jgi:hypothetical protein
MNSYSIIIQYAVQATGNLKTWTGIIPADTVGNALEQASEQLTANTQGALYIVGVICMEIKL